MTVRARIAFRCSALAIAYALSACGGPVLLPGRQTPTNGSAMAITPDDQIAVSVQRTAHVVTVFRLDPTGATTTLVPIATLDMRSPDDAAPEPWSAVIGNDGDTAFVILRHAQRLVRITHLHTAPVMDASAPTASEPTGLAMTPSGQTIYVANWAEGTLTRVRAADMTVTGSIDLNAPLVATGRLGSSTHARPGLAHPRGIVITDNGDGADDDETAYVTEFFSQARLASEPIPMNSATGLPAFDQARVGIVYSVALGSEAVTSIPIAPVADTHFPDANGHATGCIPNQLQAPALHNGLLYVASMCASPEGPIGASTAPGSEFNNFRTLMHPVVFVVDTHTQTELPDSHMVLSAEFRAVYDAASTDDTAQPTNVNFNCDGAHRRNPLLPSDIAFAPGTNEFYLSAQGADAVFHVTLAPDGRLQSVGGGALHFIELEHTVTEQGHLPIGVAIARSHPNVALVTNENSRNVEIVDLGIQAVVGAVDAAPQPASMDQDQLNTARRFFVTGVGRWAFRAQAWSSCEGCHPDGLTDGVTWFFRRGPRQPPSLAGTYSADHTRRLMSWTASFDELQDLESITRHLQGGVGAIVWTMTTPAAMDTDQIAYEAGPGGVSPTGSHATATPQDFLNGSTASISGPMALGGTRSVLPFYDYLQHYVETIRAPRSPVTLDREDVAAGRQVFVSQGCSGCHGSGLWTVSQVFYPPGEMMNNPDTGLLRTRRYTRDPNFPSAINPPSAMGDAPYRYPDRGTASGADQINCALRAVGTFPAVPTTTVPLRGIGPDELPLYEVRDDMHSRAQGVDGFNSPSLLGVGVTAPYFHGGNARSLEELLANERFQAHAGAFATRSLTPDEMRQLVAFLQSIDKNTAPIPVRSGPMMFEPDLCGSGPSM